MGEGKAIRMHLISRMHLILLINRIVFPGKSFPAILEEIQSHVESGSSFPMRTGFASICSGFAMICSGRFLFASMSQRRRGGDRSGPRGVRRRGNWTRPRGERFSFWI
ncbi:hypothetical protein Droror1_Dr00014032 [Drosera rotundifolia]